MHHVLITLLTLIIWSSAAQVQAQGIKGSGRKATPAARQKTTTPATASDAEQPKNEVEEMLLDAKKKGEVILGTCLDNCGDDSKQITGGVENGHVLALPRPTYSLLARRAHISGVVQVQVIIDEDGKVIRAAAISGHPLLFAGCLEAARNSLFTPTKFEGRAVKVTGVLQYNFVAQ